MSLLPEKHPSVANAHSRFQELNEAFVKVKYLDENINSRSIKNIHDESVTIIQRGKKLKIKGIVCVFSREPTLQYHTVLIIF